MQSLSRNDKFYLVQELLAELAQERFVAGEHPVWSLYDAYEAAATLLQLLDSDKTEAA